MSDIIELIFALVVGFFWLFGGSLFKSRQEDEPARPTSSRQRNRRKEDSQSGDSEARQREIREAILRKIAERRQQGDSEPVVVLETKPNYQEQYMEMQEEFSKPLVSAESVREEANTETFTWAVEDNAYGQEMQDRLREIEATKRRAEALKKRLKQQVAQNYYTKDSQKSSEEECILSVGSARTALKNSQNVRAAFVYSEILGKPVGLRNASEVEFYP